MRTLTKAVWAALFVAASTTGAHSQDGGIFAGVSPEVLNDTGKRPRQEMAASDASLLELGAERLEVYRGHLAILEHYYGVDRELIMGIWGIETRYGLNVGSMPIGSALRTFAAKNPSKRPFAKQQLLSATRLVRAGIINPDDLVGSYAGALGQTQFIPTSYERFGVDGDGNGTIDLWTAKDATASTANYMRQHGWIKGQPWGFAIEVPDDFYDNAENRKRQSVDYWSESTIKAKYEHTLPDKGFARVERYSGGDYLLFDNFYQILKYNNSRDYAFKVVALGDQVVHPDRAGVKETGEKINSGANIRADDAPKTVPRGPCRSKVCGAQIKLKKLGYYKGAIDGVYGPNTRAALGRYLRDNPGKGQDLLR